MKKLIAILLALVLVLSFAACASKEPAQSETETEIAHTALQILENIWAQYADDEKFAIMGGNPEGGVMDAPAVWDSAMLENLVYTTQISEEQLANVADAATMIHMMNANTFTGAVYHLAEGVDAAEFSQAVRDSVQSAQWMCGFPEKLIVAAIGDCVLVAYGVNDAMTPFEGHLAAAYPTANVLFNEAIEG